MFCPSWSKRIAEGYTFRLDSGKSVQAPQGEQRQHSKARSLLVAVLVGLVGVFFATPCAAQGCGHWAQALARSFFPRQVDEQALRAFASLSPDEYFQVVSQEEEKELAELAQSLPYQQNPWTTYGTEARLRAALQGFYQVGSQLYGVHLNPENVAVAPRTDPNAFATGSHIFMHEGLIRYFQDDWNSIYWVLAHEAAHNLMRHRDEIVLARVQTMFKEYRQAVLDHRKDAAHGRKGGGVKRYLWQSLMNFTEEFQSAEQQRAKEAEADAVALVLFRRLGYNPALGLAAGQKMAMLLAGGGARGWQAAMTQVLCSSHPDWLLRIQKMQAQLNCLQFTGRLCENHITYPVETFLPQLRQALEQLDTYQEETVRIAESGDSSAQLLETKIQVDPKDARLQVDGQAVTPGKVLLSIGPHTLYIAKDGYAPQELRIVVYPDVQPKVKIKLKKPKR